jgi:hypothetical protein
MTITLTILAASLLLLLLAELFRNIEPDWRSALAAPAIVGISAGMLTVLLRGWTGDGGAPLLAAVLITIGAGELHRRGMHTDPIEGLATGAVSGTITAVITVLFGGGDPLVTAARILLAGIVAGFVLAIIYERWNRWMVPACLLTSIASGTASLIPTLVPNVRSDALTAGVAAFTPFALIVSVFTNRAAMLAELREEAALGLFPDDQLASTTHPLRRLGRAGWRDRDVRRRFVSLSHELALRKRRQRIARPELARLYQLDVLKLRMELQEIIRVQRDMERHQEADTIATGA